MERHIQQGIGGFQTQLLCPLPEGSGYVSLLAHPCVHQPESSTEFGVQSFYWGFHCIGVIDRIIGHMVEFNLQSLSSPLPRGRASSKPQPLNHGVVFEGQPPILSHLLSINFGVMRGYSLLPRNQGQRPIKFFIIQHYYL